MEDDEEIDEAYAYLRESDRQLLPKLQGMNPPETHAVLRRRIVGKPPPLGVFWAPGPPIPVAAPR
eukprot:2274262-Lingulodinium_polyedra.AAC.1